MNKTKAQIARKIAEAKAKIAILESQKAELIKRENEREWIYIKELGIEVQKNVNPKIKKEDFIMPENCRLLTAYEFGYIFDNVPEIKITDNWEVCKSFSQKNEDNSRWSVVSLSSSRSISGDRLYVYGNWSDDYIGFAFGGFEYRLCREVKK
jgi:hypothetical protein